MGVYKSKSSLNNHSIKYLLRVFKIESLENIWEKITFSYVVDDFFQSDQFLPIYSSGKFAEQRFCDSYFGKHLTCRAAIFYNAYHDAYNAWSESPLFAENLSLVARWKSKTLL